MHGYKYTELYFYTNYPFKMYNCIPSLSLYIELLGVEDAVRVNNNYGEGRSYLSTAAANINDMYTTYIAIVALTCDATNMQA